MKFLPAVNSDRNLGPYWSEGFAIHEPWIDEDHLAAVRKAIEALHRRALGGESELAEQCVFEKNLPAAKRGGRAVDPSENAVFILSDPSRFDPTFLSIFAQAPLIRLVKEALETDEVEIHFANITTKSPAIGSGISWHRDFPNSYICPESPQMLRTMICIDGMDEENGATHFVPGTHLDNTAASDVSPTDARIVKAVCAPGAVVAIHPLVLHGGSPNFSSKWRRNIVIQWGKRGERLVPGPRESITGTSGAELAARALVSSEVKIFSGSARERLPDWMPRAKKSTTALPKAERYANPGSGLARGVILFRRPEFGFLLHTGAAPVHTGSHQREV